MNGPYPFHGDIHLRRGSFSVLGSFSAPFGGLSTQEDANFTTSEGIPMPRAD
jgi:hypothetical protein